MISKAGISNIITSIFQKIIQGVDNMNFKQAIVRRPAPSVVKGISDNSLGKPVYEKALEQHNKYVETLEECGLDVTILEPDNKYPDSTFVEDPAVLTDKCAIITNLGAESRKGEQDKIKEVLSKHYQNIEQIDPPATIEGGDVMQIKDKFYIGLSNRTNQKGADQFIKKLKKYGYEGIKVPFEGVLHLKTGVTYLGDKTMVASEELADHPLFADFEIIEVSPEEKHAANCIRINDFVIIPAGNPKVQRKIEEAGFNIKTVDISEFKKIDGGLSCLSLRFQ